MPSQNRRRDRGAPLSLRGLHAQPAAKRVLPAVMLGALCSAAVATPAQAAVSPRDAAVANATKALWNAPEQSLAVAGDKFTVKDVIVDRNGGAHVRYLRSHHGIPVVSGDLVVHLRPDGALRSMTVAQKARVTDSPTPRRSAATAQDWVKSRFGGAGRRTGEPELVYDASKGAPRLAHDVVVSSNANGVPSRLHVVTDADTGDKLRVWNEAKNAQGIGRTQYSGTRTLYTTALSGGGYSLDSTHLAPSSFCLVSGANCLDVVDSDNDWGNGTASDPNTKLADASYGLNSTLDFLQSAFGRTGVYSDGTPLRAAVGSPLDNALNSGKQEGESAVYLLFGTAAESGKPFTSIDVVAHEVAHSLTEDTANLDYWAPESGGLNEATSDIIGTLTEFSTAAVTGRPGNYTLGEATGTGKKRYMYQPSLDYAASPDCYSSNVSALNEHQSSGIANKFFFSLAEGSSGNGYGTATPCGSAPAVTGIGRQSAGRIWYQALTAHMTPTTVYQATGNNDARAATLAAAVDLFGNCSTEYRAVQAAWTAVAVAGEDLPCPTIGSTGGVQLSDTAENVITNIRNFGKSGTATIQYGPTTAYGSTMTETIPAVDSYAFAFELTGLTPGTVYHYKITNTTSTGTAVTTDKTFVTSAPPTIGSTGGVQLSDTAENVITNIRNFGKSGTATIQYGPTTAYGSTMTETIPVTDSYAFAFELTGLTPGTVYHYKITNTTSRGTAVTTDKTFVTSAPPTIGTTAGISLSPTEENVITNIRNFGKSGTATIQYGPTTAYGSTKTETIPVTDSYAFAFELTGLTPGTVYHYKITNTTSRGTAVTTDKTFTTSTS